MDACLHMDSVCICMCVCLYTVIDMEYAAVLHLVQLIFSLFVGMLVFGIKDFI